MVARLLEACGVTPSGIMTSHMTSAPLVRAGVRVNGNRLQHAIRAAAFGLHRRRAIEAPERELFKLRKISKFLDLRLAAQVRYRVYPSSQIYSSLYLVITHLNQG